MIKLRARLYIMLRITNHSKYIVHFELSLLGITTLHNDVKLYISSIIASPEVYAIN